MQKLSDIIEELMYQQGNFAHRIVDRPTISQSVENARRAGIVEGLAIAINLLKENL